MSSENKSLSGGGGANIEQYWDIKVIKDNPTFPFLVIDNWYTPEEEKDGTKLPIHMKPGDMIIYRGCDLKHWREPLWGKNHAQVFLHYNEKGGEYDIPYDGRPLLGFDASFRSEESLTRQNKLDKDLQEKQAKEKYVTENKVIDTSKKVIY